MTRTTLLFASVRRALDGLAPCALESVYGWDDGSHLWLWFLLSVPPDADTAESVEMVMTEVLSDFDLHAVTYEICTEAPRCRPGMFVLIPSRHAN